MKRFVVVFVMSLYFLCAAYFTWRFWEIVVGDISPEPAAGVDFIAVSRLQPFTLRVGHVVRHPKKLGACSRGGTSTSFLLVLWQHHR